MRTETVLVSLLALILGFTLVLVGGAVLAIKWFWPFATFHLFEYLADHALIVALTSFLFGLALLVFCTVLNRHSYLSCQMGGYSLQDSVLRQLTKHCLMHQFPNHTIHCEVVVHGKKKIEIFADLPYVEKDKQEECLYEIEEKLSEVFAKQCQLHSPFQFHARFKENERFF